MREAEGGRGVEGGSTAGLFSGATTSGTAAFDGCEKELFSSNGSMSSISSSISPSDGSWAVEGSPR